MNAPQNRDKKSKEKEFELFDITTERIDLVDFPCVPKAMIRIKKREGPDMGTEDREKDTLDGDDDLDEDDILEDLEKSVSGAIKQIEAAMEQEKDPKKKKRFNLVLANLKGMSKQKDDKEEDEKDKDKMEKSLLDDLKEELKEELSEDMKEEIEKAGRAVSKKTAAEIGKVVTTLKAALKALADLSGTEKAGNKGKKEEDEYEYPEPKKKKKVKKSIADLEELQEHTKQTYDLYKAETMDKEGRDEYIQGLFSLLEGALEEEEESEGGEE